jgi:hypothetical protein
LGVEAGNSSLLRQLSAALGGGAVLLAALTLCLGVPSARGGSLAPDPSPSSDAVRPDPYTPPVRSTPARTTHAAPTRTVVHTSVPTTTVVRTVKVSTPPPRVARKPVRHTVTAPARPPVHTTPRVVSVVRGAAHASARSLRAPALALALLVLLSAVLVAGAAREVAR